MSGDHWHEIDDLFRRALELPTADRPAFLDAECPAGAVRERVEELLRQAGEDSGDLLGSGAAYRGPLGAALERWDAADTGQQQVDEQGRDQRHVLPARQRRQRDQRHADPEHDLAEVVRVP